MNRNQFRREVCKRAGLGPWDEVSEELQARIDQAYCNGDTIQQAIYSLTEELEWD